VTKLNAAEGTIKLTDGVQWINECYFAGPGIRHVHASVYLVGRNRANVVVDSGSFYHREDIRSRLKEATGPEGVHAIILSHTDYPHAANVPAFRDEWGDIDIIASSGVPEIQGLPYATRSKIGETMEIQGHHFSFIDPPLADRSHTSWIYDNGSGVLFTADGFGNFHIPPACNLTSADIPRGIELGAIYDYHRESLVWLRYVDPDRLLNALNQILETHDISFVAPVHGNPIARENLDEYMDKLYQSVVKIAQECSVQV